MDEFDTIIPHKMHIKLKSNINTTSRKIDFQSQAVINGVDTDLIAQSANELNIQGLFKADQDERDEHVTTPDQEFKSIFLLTDIPGKIVDEFVGGITVNFIVNEWGGIHIESTNFPDGCYLGHGTLVGFSSMEGINNLISIVQHLENKEDASYLAQKIREAHEQARYFYGRSTAKDIEADDLNTLLSFFHGKKYVIELPLDFGRIEKIRKVRIIDDIYLYSINLIENNIDRISLLVTENTLTELPPIGPLYFDKKSSKYLVDESLELQAEDNSLIAESVYPDIADSLVL